MRKQKGITLIALVITIIVLLILAAVSITALTDEDKGVVTKAKQAAQKTEEAADEEDSDIEGIYDYFEEETKLTLANQIDESNYGDYVNYSKDLGLTLVLNGETSAPKTDWKIFYKNGDRVYLIAADYVPNTSSLLNASSAGMTKNGNYSLYWSGAPTALSATERQDSLFGITNSSYALNASNANSKCVSNLLDTEDWKNFVDGEVADYAIGGPTIEMYVNSWKEKGYGTITTTSESAWTGYKINGESYINMSNDKGYSDSLYYPHKTNEGIGSENCVGYWLASPSALDASSIIRVNYDGIIGYRFFDYKLASVRPVVCLKAGISATQDSNGVWQLGE